jgi:mycothiol synthase
VNVGSTGARVRRVGFRFGTDEELAAMHLVESEIEAERHPGAMPQPLASYMAFARNLPAQFDDHTWLAATDDGTPVGCSACWTNAAGDTRVMESYVYVRSDRRRRGLGWELARAVVDAAAHEGRASLVWSTYGAIAAGDAFSHRLGARVARVNRTSELDLERADWAMVRSWADDGPRRAAGYTVEFVDGPFPDALVTDAAAFQNIMRTAPREALDAGDVVLDAQHIVDLDRALVESGRERWTVLVRDPERRCIGGTELTFEPWAPSVALQQNTAIDPAHRGRGLAKWAKAAMLVRLRDERPAVRVVRTGNASSNEPMLAINHALGFAVVDVRTEWQADVPDLVRALST